MRAKVLWHVPEESFVFEEGVIISQEGSSYHIMTDRKHKLGKLREKYTDRRAAYQRHAKLVAKTKASN